MTIQSPYTEDLLGGRETTINWQQLVQNIVDEYEKHQGIVHGVQKDAVQNGWDARSHPKGEGWSFTIQLHRESKGLVYVSMTDTGTHGLTGRVLTSQEMEADLPAYERWGRFESLAFTKEEEEGAIGARGQGKFIFVGASKINQIYYDSLREDGTYRLGSRAVIGKTSSPVKTWEEGAGRDLLVKRFPSIEPLATFGTRVIIVEPIDELVEAINDGTLARAISDTWWEIIEKFSAKIIIKGENVELEATLPQHIRTMPEEDMNGFKVWLRENDTVDVSGEKPRIKRLHLVWGPLEEVPSQIRGVSIQRSGMKICIEDPPRDLPREMADGIYGYIQFDNDLDKLMAMAESVTHYDFDWRKRGAAQVRRYLGDQITAFAHEKLGFGIDPDARRKRIHNEAENRALIAANRVAKALSLKGGGKGATSKTLTGVPPTPAKPQKPIRLEMAELELPGEGLRVEYGQEIGNISVTAYNESDRNLKVMLKMWMFTADSSVVWEPLPKINFDLPIDGKIGPFGPFAITMDKDKFPVPGLYRIRARMVCMGCSSSDCPKGLNLDEITKAFYLAADPPEHFAGLFEEIRGVDFSEKYPTLLGNHVRGERGGYIYQYNLEHHAFKAVGDDRDASGEYLFRLLSQAVVEIDLQSDSPNLFDPEILKSPAQLAEKIRLLLGDWLYEYYD
jgi:hypothetical protein